MGAFILTLFIIGPDRLSAAPPMAASTQEYSSEKTCNNAKDAVQAALTRGPGAIVVAVCNPK